MLDGDYRERTDFDHAIVGGEVYGVLSAASTEESYADFEFSSIEGRRGGCISKGSKKRARCGKSEDLHIDNRPSLTVFLAVCKGGFWRLVDCGEVMGLTLKRGRETS